MRRRTQSAHLAAATGPTVGVARLSVTAGHLCCSLAASFTTLCLLRGIPAARRRFQQPTAGDLAARGPHSIQLHRQRYRALPFPPLPAVGPHLDPPTSDAVVSRPGSFRDVNGGGEFIPEPGSTRSHSHSISAWSEVGGVCNRKSACRSHQHMRAGVQGFQSMRSNTSNGSVRSTASGSSGGRRDARTIFKTSPGPQDAEYVMLRHRNACLRPCPAPARTVVPRWCAFFGWPGS